MNGLKERGQNCPLFSNQRNLNHLFEQAKSTSQLDFCDLVPHSLYAAMSPRGASSKRLRSPSPPRSPQRAGSPRAKSPEKSKSRMDQGMQALMSFLTPSKKAIEGLSCGLASLVWWVVLLCCLCGLRARTAPLNILAPVQGELFP